MVVVVFSSATVVVKTSGIGVVTIFLVVSFLVFLVGFFVVIISSKSSFSPDPISMEFHESTFAVVLGGLGLLVKEVVKGLVVVDWEHFGKCGHSKF